MSRIHRDVVEHAPIVDQPLDKSATGLGWNINPENEFKVVSEDCRWNQRLICRTAVAARPRELALAWDHLPAKVTVANAVGAALLGFGHPL